MKEYQIEIKGKQIEIIQDDDGKFLTPDFIKEQNKFGSCLKPAYEPIIVARKPFKGSLVDNIMQNGVGGINIDECRVVCNDKVKMNIRDTSSCSDGWNRPWMDDKEKDKLRQEIAIEKANNLGRFPANVILTYDETDFDEVCGGFPNTKNTTKTHIAKNSDNNINFNASEEVVVKGYEDCGSASRYFYCAKATTKDRDEGLEVEIEEYVLKEDIDENIKNNIKRLLNL